MSIILLAAASVAIVLLSVYVSRRINDAKRYQFFINLFKFKHKIVDLKFELRLLDLCFAVDFIIDTDFCGETKARYSVVMNFVDVLVINKFSQDYKQYIGDKAVFDSLEGMMNEMNGIIEKNVHYEKQCDWLQLADTEYLKLKTVIERKAKKKGIKIMDKFIGHVVEVQKEAA